MRRTYPFLLPLMVALAPAPLAAQVTVDPNALNAIGAPHIPEPPGAAAHAPRHRSHWHRHLARRGNHAAPGVPETAVASKGKAPAGPSVAELTALPTAPPPLPKPMVTLPPVVAKPEKPTLAPAQPQPPAVTAAPALLPPVPTQAVPPAPRLAETTPGIPAAAPPPPVPPAVAAPETLPKGANRLTLPFFVQDTDLPPAEQAMLRDFAQRSGSQAHYIVRAFASPPAGDDDDDASTPRRLSLARAQSVQAALLDAGAKPALIRLLAMGPAGGTPADRVEVVAVPPAASSPTP
ncbi:hypothetical protein [Acidisoma cladoniae]|jgi:outer membrane protein OmpA-like peptidoglycan-associated protein|uniref:hypothetical protein n=1 Tax=Acidisoma cladoniae TaxID=3040935 RepID=UPI00254A9D6A|nr:hypothetical protein [Acidisoma sp. PAMC 29798]